MSKSNDKQSVRKLVENLRKYLSVELKYTAGSLHVYAAPWNGVVWFAERQSIDEYSLDLGERFLREHYGIPDNPSPFISATPRNILRYIRAIKMVGEFHVTGTVSRYSNLTEYKWHSVHGNVFTEFIKYLEDIGTNNGTKMTLKYSIARFDRFIVGVELQNFNDISPELIHDFILSIGNFKSSSVANLLLALKKFLTFLHVKGCVETDMTGKVPRPKMLTDYYVPGIFSRNEIQRVLSSVNRKTALGKRDFAMLIIGADLGLRQCDILNLEPSYFNWDNNILEFVQQKTGNTISLPISEKVGFAVIDYLKNGRPETQCNKLFVMHRSPYTQFENAWYIIDKYMQRAGIENLDERRHGFHSLRHSLAGAMLDAQTPLPIISEVLGHISTNTTSRYLKIDVPNLRDCGLEVTL